MLVSWLKGHCHAIWQLYKKLESDLVLLLKTETVSCHLSLRMDENGLKLENIGKLFSSFDATCSKNPQEIY